MEVWRRSERRLRGEIGGCQVGGVPGVVLPAGEDKVSASVDHALRTTSSELFFYVQPPRRGKRNSAENVIFREFPSSHCIDVSIINAFNDKRTY